MNKEEVKNKFEIAALGCLDSYQYYKFLQSLDDELKEEFGKYQKIASLIPLSLKLEQPAPEIKNKVVIGIKKIILEKKKQSKQTETVKEERQEEILKESLEHKSQENLPTNQIDEESDEQIIQEESIVSEPVVQNKEEIILEEQEKEEDESLSEIDEELVQEKKLTPESEVKVNLNYTPLLKEEIVEEVTKRVRKTIQIQFEEFENKFNKKNKSIKIFLIIITLLLLLMTAFNVYQFLNPVEKNVEIKKEIKTPLIDKPDSLL